MPSSATPAAVSSTPNPPHPARFPFLSTTASWNLNLGRSCAHVPKSWSSSVACSGLPSLGPYRALDLGRVACGERGQQADCATVADLLVRVLHVVQPGDAFVAIEAGPLEQSDLLLAPGGHQGGADDVGHRDFGAHVADGEVIEQRLLFRSGHPALALPGLGDDAALP